MAAGEILLLLVPARGRDAVDLAQGGTFALECQQACCHKEINPALEEALHPVIVTLQEERRQELQFHLLARGIFQLKDAQERVIAMRAFALPIGGGKAIDLVALRCAVPGRGLETLALHIERHGGALPGQQVRNDKARGLAAARGRHDQRMRKDLRADVLGARLRGTELAEDEAGAGRAEKTIRLHLARRLPMGLTKACKGGAREGEAQHQAGGGKAADDQVNKLGVLRAAIADRQIVLSDIGKVDLGPEAEILIGQHRRGDGIAHGPGHQRHKQDARGDPRFSHGGAQWT
ncbi:hypothetical protein LOM8899_04568 [Flavimaricola marinus]|uniref:Uncharacterized protein n=1 Tax=Flavimaricola marinus TaxID=1819565 RepID=A0A238LNC0_9RHOB|nr:hypothetical protein LOM8899_04568 [Flavimaricola marinus]